MLFIYFLCEGKKYHNNPYFQTLFVRFALDWIGKNIYFLSLSGARHASPLQRATTRVAPTTSCRDDRRARHSGQHRGRPLQYRDYPYNGQPRGLPLQHHAAPLQRATTRVVPTTSCRDDRRAGCKPAPTNDNDHDQPTLCRTHHPRRLGLKPAPGPQRRGPCQHPDNGPHLGQLRPHHPRHLWTRSRPPRRTHGQLRSRPPQPRCGTHRHASHDPDRRPHTRRQPVQKQSLNRRHRPHQKPQPQPPPHRPRL